jgi:hypothetical protein
MKGEIRLTLVTTRKKLLTIRKWGVSNYFFWEGFGVVALETCLGSR